MNMEAFGEGGGCREGSKETLGVDVKTSVAIGVETDARGTCMSGAATSSRSLVAASTAVSDLLTASPAAS